MSVPESSTPSPSESEDQSPAQSEWEPTPPLSPPTSGSLTSGLPKRGILLLLLLVLLGFGAIPHYLAGQWAGSTPPNTPNFKALRTANEEGLSLPQWPTQEQQTVAVGGRQWSQQIVQRAASSEQEPEQSAVVLLRMQKVESDRPQVDWSDLRGERQWTEDQVSQIDLNGATIRWFRAWWETPADQIVTVGVLQWYAWPQGGHWSTNIWFWQDWQRRWNGEILPWVAVSILIPMEPLGDLQETEGQAIAIAEAVQNSLNTTVWNP